MLISAFLSLPNMEELNRQAHWENIYLTKTLEQVSWYQPLPETSLRLLQEARVPKDANIIDIGGGDSFLVDHLLELGYQNISVLDISATAIDRAKKRLGAKAEKVNWINEDVVKFEPSEKFDFWHDRAAFHFLKSATDINNYIDCANRSLTPTGVLVIGTFSETGPKKCSGIEIQQYSAESLSARFSPQFEALDCIYVDHQTPFDTTQNFVFGKFKRQA